MNELGPLLNLPPRQPDTATVLPLLSHTGRAQAETADVPVAEDSLAALVEITLSQLFRNLVSSESIQSALDRLAALPSQKADQPGIPPGLAESFTRFLASLRLSHDQVTGPKIQGILRALGFVSDARPFGEPGPITLKDWLVMITTAAEGSPLAAEAETLLASLERAQAAATVNRLMGLPLALELPIAGGLPPVRLYIEERQDNQRGWPGGQRGFRLVTLLQLSGLGQIRVDTLLTERNLAARIQVARRDVEDVAAAFLPALRQRLTALGFIVEALSTAVANGPTLTGQDLGGGRPLLYNLVNCHV